MATNQSIFEISGAVGDLIFSRRKKKTTVKKKSDKKYQLSENSIKSGRDLAEASKFSKILRKAFANMVEEYGDEELYYRLTSCIYKVLKTIPNDELGKKLVKNGDVSVLRGFRFKADQALDSLLYRKPSISITGNGNCLIDFDVLPDTSANKKVENADEVVLQISLFCHNFDDDTYKFVKVKDLVKPQLKSAKLKLTFDLKGEVILFVIMGIHYLGNGSRINDKRFKAAEITDVIRLRDGVEVHFKKKPEAVVRRPIADEAVDWDEE